MGTTARGWKDDRARDRAKPLPHIAVFLPKLGGGGAERVTLGVAKGFMRRGLAVDLLVTRSGPYVDLVPQYARVINFESRKALTCFRPFLRYLRTERPDGLLSTLIHTSILTLIVKKYILRKLPTIVRYESTYSMSFENGTLKERMELSVFKYLLSAADAIIAVSDGAAADLKRTIPGASRRVHVVPNPVVTCELVQQARVPVEHPFFRDPDIPVVVSAGRLVSPKDYPTLLRAFAEVAGSRAARLVILGEGAVRGELVSLTRKLGIADAVDFAGFQLNPFAYMAKAQVFVLSSIYEGLGNVLIEAMACGTPVVSTDCRHGPREILEGGKWGQLVPVRDWRALASAIHAAIDNPLSPELLIARASHYSADASTDAHLRILDEVMRKQKKSRTHDGIKPQPRRSQSDA